MTQSTNSGLSRRRFLTISAAAVCATSPASGMSLARWSGWALGAQTSMQLSGLTEADARPVFGAVERELGRLERIFSLYSSESQLVQLNATGALRNPAPEMLELLSLCDRLHRATGGVFDPTVQPLWMGHAQAATRGQVLTKTQEEEFRTLVDWNRVQISPGEIRLGGSGMALTLNGVAQGFVTDRIAALLRLRGLHNVLIDMGEIAALGQRPDGAKWNVGIADPDGTIVNRVLLKDRAIATSAPSGTLLNAESGIGHILNPRKKDAKPVNRLVAISSDQAAIADGLSTAGCLMHSADLAKSIGTFPNTKLETLI